MFPLKYGMVVVRADNPPFLVKVKVSLTQLASVTYEFVSSSKSDTLTLKVVAVFVPTKSRDVVPVLYVPPET